MGRASRPGNGRDIVHRLAAPPSKPPALLRPPHPHHDLAQPPALLNVGPMQPELAAHRADHLDHFDDPLRGQIWMPLPRERVEVVHEPNKYQREVKKSNCFSEAVKDFLTSPRRLPELWVHPVTERVGAAGCWGRAVCEVEVASLKRGQRGIASKLPSAIGAQPA